MTEREQPQHSADHEATWRLLALYGLQQLPMVEARAYVGELDRMGAFSATERTTLRDAGLLG